MIPHSPRFSSGEGSSEMRSFRSAQSSALMDIRRDQLKELMSKSDGEREKRHLPRVHSAPRLTGSDESLPKIIIGICAMDKKARSKQMQNIVKRLLRHGEFEVITFGDDTIVNRPVEEWPVVSCLLAWHSEGFPLKKAQQYVILRRPYLVNDVFAQDLLLDRRKVYRKLKESGIPVPHHIIVDRDHLSPGESPPGFLETDDSVELNGERIHKPFVEKPASGDDHNIYIYYPFSMGGGVKKLFRKVNNRSADYDPTHPGTVRRDASYIYEDFLTTGGTDVKVYTVGPRYAHAEARKSPVVDGKVQRAADGKELRYPVLLTPQEKEVARMVSLAFGQRVCGFDLLRSERGRSYVCDVNGWSFVKNSTKYYDDTAGILRMVILSALAPHRLLAPLAPPLSLSDPSASLETIGSGSLATIPASTEDEESAAAARAVAAQVAPAVQEHDQLMSDNEELRCVLAVIRHGDRTPKQKMKLKVTQPALLALCHKYLDSKGKQAKLKSPSELQDLLDVTRGLLEELENSKKEEGEEELSSDNRAELSSAKDEEMSTQSDSNLPPKSADDIPSPEEYREKFRIVKSILEQGGQFSGINRKVQFKPLRWTLPEPGSAAADKPRISEALLILKHGGVLTHAGRAQAEALGSLFRNAMYPQHGPAGGGLLRLHSTYRHDLKIYSSDEGRVQCSAAAFTKGLLDLEGSALTPILVSLVTKDTGLLEAFGKGASEDIQRAKAELYSQMTFDPDTGESRGTVPHSTTPLVSPPLSPKPAAPGSATPGLGGAGGSARSLYRSASNGSQSSTVIRAAASALSTEVATSSVDAEMPTEGASNLPGRPRIFPMPPQPLELLKRVRVLLADLVERLHDLCVNEKKAPQTNSNGITNEKKNGSSSLGTKGTTDTNQPRRTYSVLNQEPKDWVFEDDKPCGGERLLLLYDRWRKLAKAFYNVKKDQFDISKVPDIYDAAKYDALHNASLMGPRVREIYEGAKALADAVIPNEYGIDPRGRLRISTAICSQLLGKLLADMAYMREESIATAGIMGDDPADSVADELQGGEPASPRGCSPSTASMLEDDENDDSSLHRLCPSYATDINSPLRHVRTRIYFTSESHMHALLNVLRFAHLGKGLESDGAIRSVLSEEGRDYLAGVRELDYMTHWVFRMFENKSLPMHDPRRFRVQILFSPGAAYNPVELSPPNHTLRIAPRKPVHFKDNADDATAGVPLSDLETTLRAYAKPFKRAQDSNPYQGVDMNPQASEFDWMVAILHGAATEPDRLMRSAAAVSLPIKALLVDAAGTLLVPSEPSAKVYLRYAKKYGDVSLTEEEILQRFRRAYNAPYKRSPVRYVGDGRPFWREIVAASTGLGDERFFEDVYGYFACGSSWTVAPDAICSLLRIRASGIKLAIVSNFDTRRRPILEDIGLTSLFDAVIVSAELGIEKPNPTIFEAACESLGVEPSEALHVGDDRRNDVVGARSAGCYAWLWGQDVLSFQEMEIRLAAGNLFDSLGSS